MMMRGFIVWQVPRKQLILYEHMYILNYEYYIRLYIYMYILIMFSETTTRITR